MLTEDDIVSLEWWWCPETGLPIEVCDCKECREYRKREEIEHAANEPVSLPKSDIVLRT